MDIEILRKINTIQEFFGVPDEGEIAPGTRRFLEAMEEVTIPAGEDIVTYGHDSEDGMYVILSGQTDVLSGKGDRINSLGVGDFIGELGLINDDKRAATVRAVDTVRCAHISRPLFDEIAQAERKIYGTFMNMLYSKTTKLVTEQERMKSELAVATRIQVGCLEWDFTAFNAMEHVNMNADMRPAKEVGGDFFDVFQIDENRLCFLIADVSGKGVPAALFMSMAKTHIKNYATLGLPLGEVMSRANNQLCYKNEEGMFVTVFICVLDVKCGDVTFVNAGHNRPFVKKQDGGFHMQPAKANLVLGMMEDMPYKEQHLELLPGDSIYLYTDGVTEALNPEGELLGDDRIEKILNDNLCYADAPEIFLKNIYDAVDTFADGAPQADDITMLYLART